MTASTRLPINPALFKTPFQVFRSLRKSLLLLGVAFLIVSGANIGAPAMANKQKSGKTKTNTQAKSNRKTPPKVYKKSQTEQPQSAGPDKTAIGPWPAGTPAHWVLIRPGVTVCLETADDIIPLACKERSQLEEFAVALKQGDRQVIAKMGSDGQCIQIKKVIFPDEGVVRAWNNGAWQVEMSEGEHKGSSFWVSEKFVRRCGAREPQPKLDDVLSRAETTTGVERRIYAYLNAMLLDSPTAVLGLIEIGQPAIVPTGNAMLAAVQAYGPMKDGLEKIADIEPNGPSYATLRQEWFAVIRMITGCTKILGEIGDQRALLLLKRFNFSGTRTRGPFRRAPEKSLEEGIQQDINTAIERITSRLEKRR